MIEVYKRNSENLTACYDKMTPIEEDARSTTQAAEVLKIAASQNPKIYPPGRYILLFGVNGSTVVDLKKLETPYTIAFI